MKWHFIISKLSWLAILRCPNNGEVWTPHQWKWHVTILEWCLTIPKDVSLISINLDGHEARAQILILGRQGLHYLHPCERGGIRHQLPIVEILAMLLNLLDFIYKICPSLPQGWTSLQLFFDRIRILDKCIEWSSNRLIASFGGGTPRGPTSLSWIMLSKTSWMTCTLWKSHWLALDI
jgi:hypothetical protein